MSYMELKVIDKNGNVAAGKEYKNSWGGAAFIWNSLCKKYNVIDQYGYNSFEAWGMLWSKVEDEIIKLEPFEYNVLLFTYDNALVRGKDMQLFSNSLKAFDKEHRANNLANHCLAMATDIERFIKDGNIHGLGLYATSVGEDPWVEWNDDNCYPYNIKNNNNHWFIKMRSL